MKYLIAALLIISFIGVGVFGFALMSMPGDGEHDVSAGCLAESMNGVLCPKDLFEYVSFHVSAFSKFLNAVFIRHAGEIFSIAAIWVIVSFSLGSLKQKLQPLEYSFAPVFAYKSARKLKAWGSLLETSPTLR